MGVLMPTMFISGITRGIGRETAFLCARQGWTVYGCGRDATLLAEINRVALDQGLSLRAFRMDVTSEEERERSMAWLLQETKGEGVDVLVNNAGYQELAPVEDLTLEGWRRQFETNVFGMLAVTQALLPTMRARKQGRIINLSSVAGRVGFPLYGAYCASKHAVEGMTDALRMEVRPFGIQVVLVEPGPIVSNINVTGYANLARNRPHATAYAGLYDAGPAKLEGIEKRSLPTRLVAETIVRAATVKHPRQRYRVTRTATLALVARLFLPGRLTDRILGGSI